MDDINKMNKSIGSRGQVCIYWENTLSFKSFSYIYFLFLFQLTTFLYDFDLFSIFCLMVTYKLTVIIHFFFLFWDDFDLFNHFHMIFTYKIKCDHSLGRHDAFCIFFDFITAIAMHMFSLLFLYQFNLKNNADLLDVSPCVVVGFFYFFFLFYSSCLWVNILYKNYRLHLCIYTISNSVADEDNPSKLAKVEVPPTNVVGVMPPGSVGMGFPPQSTFGAIPPMYAFFAQFLKLFPPH